METLEIKLCESIESRRKVIEKVKERVVLVQHDKYGKVKGKVESFTDDQFDIRTPTNDILAMVYAKVYTLSYDRISKLELVRPTAMDCITEARKDYHS
ncbi:MAG: hypothetical protein WCI72_01700 [archaeon]